MKDITLKQLQNADILEKKQVKMLEQQYRETTQNTDNSIQKFMLWTRIYMGFMAVVMVIFAILMIVISLTSRP